MKKLSKLKRKLGQIPCNDIYIQKQVPPQKVCRATNYFLKVVS